MPPGERRGGMLLRAMLAHNVGTGCLFGGLGVSILALKDRYDTSLGMATMGMSLAILSMTALGPFIAGLLSRWGLRAVMTAGVLISSVGYLALAFAPDMLLALAACGLVIGPSVALFAALPPAVLVGGWYPHARGRAMGIAYLPLFATLIPVVGIAIIRFHGLTTFFLAMAALNLLLLPLMLGVREPPAEPGSAAALPGDSAEPVGIGLFLGVASFWIIALGKGILNGTAIASSVLMLPIVKEYGSSEEAGALLLSISGAASMLGSLIAGFSSDRLGAGRTLGLAGTGLAIAWLLIAFGGWLPSLTVAAVLIGVCGGAVFPPMSALVVQIFGIKALPKALGLLGIFTLPFTFAMSPAAGWMRDLYGNYNMVIAVFVVICLSAAAAFFTMRRSTLSSIDCPSGPSGRAFNM